MFVERDLRKLALTNHIHRIDITVPVRQVRKWAARRSALEELLRFMGGHDWHLDFAKSILPLRNAEEQSKDSKKALVKAFDRLHMVLAENSGYCGPKYSRWTSGSRLLGASSLPSMKAV
jgi:hypothetical protein